MLIDSGSVKKRFTNPEKRRWERYDANARVRVLAEGGEDPLIIEGRCVKISDGGMCLFAVANFSPGTQISIDFVDQAHQSVTPATRVRGTIRNRAVYLYGVEREAQGATGPRLR